MTLKERLLFVRDGGAVERFHSAPTLCGETVGHHSFGVAWMCWFLTDGTPSANLLLAALAHDLAEQETGDLPAPFKGAPGVQEAVHRREDELLYGAGMKYTHLLTPEEYNILRRADVYDGMLFCWRERAMGNRLIAPVFCKYMEYTERWPDKNEIDRALLDAIEELWGEADQPTTAR